MRKVTKDFNDIPAILLSQSCKDLIHLSLTEKGKHDFKTGIYGHTEVRQKLDDIYHSKCCFCETDTSAGATLQVEHYRPKAKITGIKTHPGYYWLGYQWSNLLLACSSCNNRKRNRFPTIGIRITTHPITAEDFGLDIENCNITSPLLLAENAQIINPEIDTNPMRHFRFQADGTIDHNTPEGKATIDTCNLNRGGLVVKRKKLYDLLFKPITQNIGRHQRGEINDDQLHQRLLVSIQSLVEHIIDDSSEYIEFAKTCWNEFENFFLARFQPVEQALLRTAFVVIKTEYDAA